MISKIDLLKKIEGIELGIELTYVQEDILKMTTKAGSGHPGGSLSISNILIALYFGKVYNKEKKCFEPILRYNPSLPDWPGRDRVILSKGHAAPSLYSILQKAGYFPREKLWILRKLGSMLQGHPEMYREDMGVYKGTPGVDMTTGSLATGILAASGMALAAKLDKKDYRVWAVLGDGETQKGDAWSAFLTIPNKELTNLCVIIDRNGLEIDGDVKAYNDLGPLDKKLDAFNFEVKEINGHNFDEILDAFAFVKNYNEKPVAIIAYTLKGKSCVPIEDDDSYHGKPLEEDSLENALPQYEDRRRKLQKKKGKIEKYLNDDKAIKILNQPTEFPAPSIIKKEKSLEECIKEIKPRDYEGLVPTRTGYGNALRKIGAYEKIIVLNADLTESTKSFYFVLKYPERSENLGVQEEGMFGMAAGLAACGKIPFTNTFAIFCSENAGRTIRQLIAQNKLNVKIVGTHEGVEVGPDGSTHQAVLDLAFFRILPNMVVLNPSDCTQAEYLTFEAAKHQGPVYIRLAREGFPQIYSKNNEFGIDYRGPFEIGKGYLLKEGKDAAIIASGPLVSQSLEASQVSEYKISVVDMPTTKPVDEQMIIHCVKETGAIVVAQDHSIKGALGDEVLEVMAKHNRYAPLIKVGLNDEFGQSGSPEELYKHYGFDAAGLCKAVEKVVERK